MEGCIKEVTEALEEDEEGALKDAGIIGAALRTEHYEIAGYSAAIAMAKTLKQAEIVQLLTESLKEEQAAAKDILSGAGPILKEANSQEDEEDEKDSSSEEQESEAKSEQDEQEAAPELGEKTTQAKKSTRRRKAPSNVSVSASNHIAATSPDDRPRSPMTTRKKGEERRLFPPIFTAPVLAHNFCAIA